MTTDLRSKTVEELRQYCFDGGMFYGITAFDELARRLEEAQQQIVAQQAAMQSTKDELFPDTTAGIVPWKRVSAARSKLSGEFDALTAHDADVAAEVLEELAEEYSYRDELHEWLLARAVEYRAKAKGEKP